jgi:hypothetical protein
VVERQDEEDKVHGHTNPCIPKCDFLDSCDIRPCLLIKEGSRPDGANPEDHANGESAEFPPLREDGDFAIALNIVFHPTSPLS